MANEIKNLDDAKNRLRELFAPSERDDIDKKRLRNEVDLEDYAKIAVFLTDNKRVRTALETVSAQVWDQYRHWSMEKSPNRFSQAIINYASKRFGFAAQGNVVFIGPLGGPEFLGYVRDGVLWKDTFAPGHGEFSHSLQWLAAGVALNLDARIVELYKKAGNIFSNRKMYSRDGNTGVLVHAVQPLWAWMVDCFPPTSGEEVLKSDGTDHVFSKKACRVPNNINTLASTQIGWFVSAYLTHRRDWLRKLAEEGKKMRKEEGEVRELESNLLGIVRYQKEKYPTNTDWETNHGSGNVLAKTTVQKTDKDQVWLKFHGKWGTVSMKAIESKSLVS
jgi:hypothetical protein